MIDSGPEGDDASSGQRQDFDAANQTAIILACQAMREIITSEVVHHEREHARQLVEEYAETHGLYLPFVAATFVWYHTTDSTGPELAEDRFFYLLTRLGNLNELLANADGTDSSVRLIELLNLLSGTLAVADEDDTAADNVRLFAAAQTCLVAHHFVRLGHAPWGIQRNLDRSDMLRLNGALAKVLVLMVMDAVDQRFDHCERVVLTLLDDARRILIAQARAAGTSVEALVAEYFSQLQFQDSAVLLEGEPPSQ